MTTINFAAKSSVIRQFVDEHRNWIEDTLGVGMCETMQLRFECGINSIVAAFALPNGPQSYSTPFFGKVLKERITRIEWPNNITPAMSIETSFDAESSTLFKKLLWSPNWLDCPVALYVTGLPHPFIFLNVPLIAGCQSSGAWREVIIVRKDCVQDCLSLMREVMTLKTGPQLHTLNSGSKSVRFTKWEDLILDPSIVRLLQNDYENFFKRESWFKQNNLAFRRGYLLHGPPGNGKTSAVRAMLSHPGVSGYTINLFTEHVDDDQLTSLFERAASHAPSVVVLEDIDRFFAKKHEDDKTARVSLQHLLNCLDGATTQDGVIVVATANNPRVLDPAILRRPGRFDRVVGFPNPTRELRIRYFEILSVDIKEGAIAECANASEGFSFAQLQESYILAGQFAFDEDRPITGVDITMAIATLRKSLLGADRKGEVPAGFQAG
jgi:hypothetical protein